MEKNFIDCRQTALTKSKLSLVYVDITQSAKELERSHLCGPTAGLVQSDALAAVALLGAELNRKEEAITLRFRVSGPVAGLLVENTYNGGLRGYTHNKVLNALDARDKISDEDALGELAQMTVVRSIPGKTISSAMIDVHPASISKGMHQYLNKSLQRKAEVVIAVASTVSGVTYAKAFMFERMPDGDSKAFKKLSGGFKDGSTKQALIGAHSLEELCSMLKIGDCKLNIPQSLRFKCRCSAERVESMVGGLPDADLKDMFKSSEITQIICHMCGTGYNVGKELLWSILEKRGHDIEVGEHSDYD